MNEEDEKWIAARLAKTMAMMCFRNTKLEDLHAGLTPVTRAGDYSDVAEAQVAGPLSIRRGEQQQWMPRI